MYKDLHQFFLTSHSDAQNKNKTRFVWKNAVFLFYLIFMFYACEYAPGFPFMKYRHGLSLAVCKLYTLRSLGKVIQRYFPEFCDLKTRLVPETLFLRLIPSFFTYLEGNKNYHLETVHCIIHRVMHRALVTCKHVTNPKVQFPFFFFTAEWSWRVVITSYFEITGI